MSLSGQLASFESAEKWSHRSCTLGPTCVCNALGGSGQTPSQKAHTMCWECRSGSGQAPVFECKGPTIIGHRGGLVKAVGNFPQGRVAGRRAVPGVTALGVPNTATRQHTVTRVHHMCNFTSRHAVTQPKPMCRRSES